MSQANDEFDAAFSEAAKGLNGEPAPDAKSGEANEPEGASGAAAPEGAGTGESSPAAGAESGAGAAPAAEASSNDNPGQGVDTLRAELQAALQRERSVAGRISAVDRANNQLRQQVQELQATLNQLTDAQKAKLAAPAAEPPKPDTLDEAPDLKQAVERRVQERVEPLVQKLDEVTRQAKAAADAAANATRRVEPIAQREHEDTIRSTHEALDKEFTPAWREHVRSPAFHAWVEEQPEAIQQLYQKAVTPKESAKVMRLYYAETGKAPAATTPTEAAPAAPTTTTPNDAAQQRLRAATGIPSRSTARPNAPAEDDFEGNFGRAFRSINQSRQAAPI